MAAAERAVLTHDLARLDVDRPAVTIQGQRHHRVLRSPATYTSAVGPITVLLTMYCAGCEQAVVPLELRGHHQRPPEAAGGGLRELSGGSFDVPAACDTLRESGHHGATVSDADGGATWRI